MVEGVTWLMGLWVGGGTRPQAKLERGWHVVTPCRLKITTSTYSYLFLVLKHNIFKISLSKFL